MSIPKTATYTIGLASVANVQLRHWLERTSNQVALSVKTSANLPKGDITYVGARSSGVSKMSSADVNPSQHAHTRPYKSGTYAMFTVSRSTRSQHDKKIDWHSQTNWFAAGNSKHRSSTSCQKAPPTCANATIHMWVRVHSEWPKDPLKTPPR